MFSRHWVNSLYTAFCTQLDPTEFLARIRPGQGVTKKTSSQPATEMQPTDIS